MGLTGTLHRDGILFFLVGHIVLFSALSDFMRYGAQAVTCFRTVNIIFATNKYPNRILYAGL